jgi:hypothetical protein
MHAWILLTVVSSNTRQYSGEATVGRRGSIYDTYSSFQPNAAQRNDAVVLIMLSWVVIISIFNLLNIINNVYFIYTA